MPFVFRVGQGLQVVGISIRAAGVLRRPAAPAIHAARIPTLGLRRQDALDHDIEAPTVAKVVLIGEADADLPDGGLQPGPAFISYVALEDFGKAVEALADVKLVEVGIFPAHDDLEDLVELRECDVGPDVDAPPDRGIDVSKLDLELVDRPRCCWHSWSSVHRRRAQPACKLEAL
jgi:hypothetical protein